MIVASQFPGDPPQGSVPLSKDCPDERSRPETPERRWLQWLDWEVASWLHPDAGPANDEPQKIRLVLQMLANENEPSGYEAESWLAQSDLQTL